MEFGYKHLYSNGCIASWYLRDSQLIFYDMLQRNYALTNASKTVTAKCHRRFGKGTTVLTYVAEKCLQKKITVRYIAETQLQAFQIFNFLITKIFARCPELKPKLSTGKYIFPSTGSEVYIGGVKDSGEIDKLRGVESDIIICDEYGFWKFKAEYVLTSVLRPQLLETDGQMIITSTPPEDITHEYINQVHLGESNGTLFDWTIDDSHAIGEKTDEELAKIIEDCGGRDSVSFRREYLCKLIPTPERLVIPECQNENLFIGKKERPTHFDYYICMDLGLVDKTAVLFAYLDFESSTLVVEREYCSNYKSTKEIVDSCLEIEDNLSIGVKARKMRRIGDTERQQLYDMSTDHGYQVSPIVKASKISGMGFRDSVINRLRIGINSRKVLIDPEGCPELVKQLKYGIWNERRTDFERTESLGHLDATMSLCYLYDNIAWNDNPFPAVYDKYNVNNSFVSTGELSRRKNAGNFGRLIGR